MRFKAQIRHPRILRDICGSLASIRKTCQLRLSPKSLCFISTVSTDSVQVWSRIAVETIFDEFDIASVDNDNIAMELNVDILHRSLKSCCAATSDFDDPVIRLRKRDKVAYLAVMFEQRTLDSDIPNMISQELPVRLLRLSEATLLKEPVHPNPNVYIMLPTPIGPFLRICDKYKSISSVVKLDANWQGELSLSTDDNEANMVKVTTTWKGTENINVIASSAQGSSGDIATVNSVSQDTSTYSVHISAKEWINALQISSVVRHIVLGVCHEHALILYCYVTGAEDEEDGVLTYYIANHDT